MNALLTPPKPRNPRAANEAARAEDAASAEERYRALLAQEPDHAEALYRLARLLQQRGGEHDEVNALLARAAAAQPENPLLHTTRAAALTAQGRHLDALECIADAARLLPATPELLYNLGLLCAELCCPAQAEVIARRLLQHRPDWPQAHYLLVRALTGQSSASWELDAEYEFLLRSDPLSPSLRFARGLHRLRKGDYAAGWEEQEWRWEIEPAKSSRLSTPRPRWSGGPLSGRRLLVLGEQGFGDVLQFCRYLPLLIERGAHVILRLDANRASLARLLRRIPGLEVTAAPAQLPDHDLYCPLASLPYAFGTSTESIPNAVYLTVDPRHVDEWRQRLSSLPRPWVGVCWAGSDEHDHNIRRTLPLTANGLHFRERQMREQRIYAVAERVERAWGLGGLVAAAKKDGLPSHLSLEPLLHDRPGSYISLQMGPRAAELHELAPELAVAFLAPLMPAHDFYDTACLVSALDEVITVDTSVAHLTGSLGRQGTVIKPAAAEWRWLERGGAALWYPSLSLMEQTALPVRPRDLNKAA